MEENNNPQEINTKQEKKKSKGLRYIILWIKRFVSLRFDNDNEATVQRIEEGIEFRGANVWILAFAIIVACIGLNINSTAVLIGAMLLSPLMGPIMGIGLAVGISDNNMLKHSLSNFAAMVIISIMASTFYFLISPLSDAQSELLARTRPTIYDVMIAFFGGLAGIIANSRKKDKYTVFLGVVIATALMPPLCTAGYGIATGNWNFFIGAFYLFFINTFFIALATFIMAYYLKIPKRAHTNPLKAKRVNRYISLFAAIVCIPSVFMAINMIQESSFNSSAIRFVNDLEQNPLLEDVQIVKSSREYSKKQSTITIALVGKPLEEKQIEDIRQKLPDFGLKNTHLIVRQLMSDDDKELNISGEFMEDLYKQNVFLSDEITRYRDEVIRLQGEIIPNDQIAKEIQVQFKNIHSFSISKTIYTDIETLSTDTIPTAYIVWNKKPKETETEQLDKWLKVRLNLDKLKLSSSVYKKEE
jgi:uncharacterized hydrophobic protein (TIGR00271 family)